MTTRQESTKKVSRKRAAPPVVVDVPGSAEDPDEPLNRQEMIATAAYYLAEQRGFSEGGDVEDWLAAEDEVERYLSGAGLTRSGDIP